MVPDILGMKCDVTFSILIDHTLSINFIKLIYLLTGLSWTFLAIISLHALVSVLLLVGVMKVCIVPVSSQSKSGKAASHFILTDFYNYL
jgi:hypothetical protein